MPASFVLSRSSVKQRGREQDREPRAAHSTCVTIVLRWWYMLSVIVVVAGCRCRRWGTANYSSILMRGRKIGSRMPEIEPGSRTFET